MLVLRVCQGMRVWYVVIRAGWSVLFRIPTGRNSVASLEKIDGFLSVNGEVCDPLVTLLIVVHRRDAAVNGDRFNRRVIDRYTWVFDHYRNTMSGLRHLS